MIYYYFALTWFGDTRSIFYKKQSKKWTSHVSYFSQKFALVLFLICFLIFPFHSLIFHLFFYIPYKFIKNCPFYIKKSFDMWWTLTYGTTFWRLISKIATQVWLFELRSKKDVSYFFLKQLVFVSYFIQKLD